MGEISPTPPSAYSANSQKIKRFQLSQRFSNLAILAVIGVPLVLGGVIYTTYKQMTAPDSENIALSGENPDPTVDPNQATLDPNAMIDPATGAPIGATPGTASPSNGASGSSASPRTPATQSAPSGTIPDGVVVAINSIASSGIKNNPYVEMDTNNVPDGTVVTLDRNTWSPVSADEGTVSGTLTVFGSPYNGSVTFKNLGGTWKVVGYSLN